jgi:hypothetical protein
MQDYLRTSIILPMRQAERRELCLKDQGIYRYLLSSTYNKLRCPSLVKNIRAYAHLICRFFLPLFEKHNWASTREALKMSNRDELLEAVLQFGGIQKFYEDTDSFIQDLENEAVGFIVTFSAYLTILIYRLAGPLDSTLEP